MKKFLVMWASQAFSLMGSAVVEFALAWYLTRETGKAAILATAYLVAMIPPIIVGPLIGPFIDRWNRKLIMIFGDLAVTLVTIILIILFLTDTIQVWHIYVAMVLRAIGQSFQFPAMMAAVSTIVPEKDLARANGLNQTLQGIITIAAPPLGAFLMEMLPMQGVLSIDIITAAIAIVCLLFIFIPRPARTTLSEKPHVIKDMMQSLRYIRDKRGLSLLMGMVALLGLFTTPMFVMYPVLVNVKLAGDVMKLGWYNSTFGIGMILGGLILGVWGGFKKRIMTSFLGIIFMGATTIGLGFTSVPLFYLMLAVNLVLGISIAIANAPFMAIMNSVVAKDMQGRLFSLLGSISSVMAPLGLAFSGPVADALGIEWIYFFSGAAVMVVTPFFLFSRSVMDLENHPAEQSPASEPPTLPEAER